METPNPKFQAKPAVKFNEFDLHKFRVLAPEQKQVQIANDAPKDTKPQYYNVLTMEYNIGTVESPNFKEFLYTTPLVLCERGIKVEPDKMKPGVLKYSLGIKFDTDTAEGKMFLDGMSALFTMCCRYLAHKEYKVKLGSDFVDGFNEANPGTLFKSHIAYPRDKVTKEILKNLKPNMYAKCYDLTKSMNAKMFNEITKEAKIKLKQNKNYILQPKDFQPKPWETLKDKAFKGIITLSFKEIYNGSNKCRTQIYVKNAIFDSYVDEASLASIYGDAGSQLNLTYDEDDDVSVVTSGISAANLNSTSNPNPSSSYPSTPSVAVNGSSMEELMNSLPSTVAAGTNFKIQA